MPLKGDFGNSHDPPGPRQGPDPVTAIGFSEADLTLTATALNQVVLHRKLLEFWLVDNVEHPTFKDSLDVHTPKMWPDAGMPGCPEISR